MRLRIALVALILAVVPTTAQQHAQVRVPRAVVQRYVGDSTPPYPPDGAFAKLENIGGGIGRLPNAAMRKRVAECVDSLPARR